jgi:hypothetical protein
MMNYLRGASVWPPGIAEELMRFVKPWQNIGEAKRKHMCEIRLNIANEK